MDFDFDWIQTHPWAGVLLGALLALAIAGLVHHIGYIVVHRLLRFSRVLTATIEHVHGPAGWLLPLAALQVVWEGAPPTLQGIGAIRHVNGVLLIAAITAAAIAAVKGITDGVLELHPVTAADNLAARRIETQARVLSRTAIGALVVAGLAFVLMTFPGARQVGASLLASAGVIGLVAGIAARPVFSNLIAGLQIALAQPIRIDDVLVVEGEWGRVEEITGTYVVMRLWDERRLIVPLQYFIDKPFQNWTRTTSDIVGTVFLWVDYRTPLEPLRTAVRRTCEASRDWDRRVSVLQVTDANERAVQLRVLVSSASAGQNWDLRCAVREALVDLLQRDYPDCLPRVRGEIEQAAQATAIGQPLPQVAGRP